MTTNRMLLNLNRNARNLHRIDMQIASQSRIQNPSDDPIIASRALRFRTNVSEIVQFRENADRALRWMDVTESSMSNILSSVRTVGSENLVQGANGILTQENRQTIAAQINAFFAQMNSELNGTFAGRYVFSGFRTDRPPIATSTQRFMQGTNPSHVNVEHNVHAGDMQSFPLHFWREPNGNLQKMGSMPDPDNAGQWIRDPKFTPINIINLPFREISSSTSQLGFDRTLQNVRLTSGTTELSEANGGIVRMSLNGSVNPYVFGQGNFSGLRQYDPVTGDALYDTVGNPLWEVAPQQDPIIVFIPETGEFVIPEALKANFNGAGMTVDYDINGVVEGELNPHIFFNTIDHTYDPPRTFSQNNQDIQFEMGTNVRLTVNTQAKNAYPWQLFADLSRFMQLVNDAVPTPDISEDADAAERGFFGSVLYERFSNMIGIIEGHNLTISIEATNLGSRMNRVELIEERLEENYETFTDLMSLNENIDLIEAMMRFNAAEAVMQAAMNVGARISQLSLVNFL